MTNLQQAIYKVLTQHIDKCKLHKAIHKALHPFIVIHPKHKAEDIADMLEKIKDDLIGLFNDSQTQQVIWNYFKELGKKKVRRG